MTVIKNTTIYLGVSVFQSLMSFLLLPVFTFFLTKTEFGLASVINSVAGLLGLLFVFGTQSVISRLYFEYKDDPEKLKRFYFENILEYCNSIYSYTWEKFHFSIYRKRCRFQPIFINCNWNCVF